MNWWLEYLEGELDSKTRLTMSALLRKSKRDQAAVDEISSLKEDIRSSSSVDLSSLREDYFDALHDKIMAQVHERPAPSRKAPSWRVVYLPVPVPRNPWSWIKSSAAFFVVLAISLQMIQNLKKSNSSFAEQILTKAKSNPSDFAEMLSYQSGDDFFVDVASRNLDDLTISQVEDMVGKIQ